MRKILFILVIGNLLGCSKRLGNYPMRVSGSTFKTVKKAAGNKELSEMIIDTLAKAHPDLVRVEVVQKTDTLYLPPRQRTKEMPSNLRFTQEDIDKLLSEFKKQKWSLLDSMIHKAGNADPLHKTIGFDMMPLLNGLRPNSDTLVLQDSLRGITFRAWMHKGVLLGEEKADRFAVAVTKNTTERNIKPALNCPPKPSWWSFYQTWIACAVVGLLLYVVVRLAKR